MVKALEEEEKWILRNTNIDPLKIANAFGVSENDCWDYLTQYWHALREAEEEIGIDRKSVTLIGELSPLYIPVSNFMVQPFVGTMNNTPEFKTHPAEVHELLEIELNKFLSEKNKKNVRRFIKTEKITIEVPCYEIID